ncbi:MAG: cell division protein ZapA [Clostridiales bacterium]|nr:cell division protein ZapA [Clostridiales bacterium]MCD8108956.1 cell division protein ZapA [Clostridiales bacterium]MCD8132789.1 cell division protein ZapA [Clostridiales bacterium]
MSQNNTIEVVIGGKVLAMSGAEDEEVIHRMASYVNGMIRRLESTQVYRSLPTDLKPILIELNIAEELMQAQETIRQLEADLRMKENELSEVKQSLVEAQLKLEHSEGKKRR